MFVNLFPILVQRRIFTLLSAAFVCTAAYGQAPGTSSDPCANGIAYFPVANDQTIGDRFQLPMVASSGNGCQITAVRLYVDGQPYQTQTVNDPSKQFTFSNVSLTDGYHNLFGVVLNQKGFLFATDNFRVFSSAENVKVFVNSPGDGTTISGTYQTVDIRVRLGGSTLENPHTDVTHLTVYLDNQPVYDTDNSSANFKESFSVGTHRMVAVAYDAQGYSYTGSSTFTVK